MVDYRIFSCFTEMNMSIFQKFGYQFSDTNGKNAKTGYFLYQMILSRHTKLFASENSEINSF